ncbi:MAG TPA: amidohydrolase family protein [Reyranella sp.]|nr:amidohydrolase family protein [Reyranella sp.]
MIRCIKKARWVVAWDPHLKQHFFRNDVDVVFDGNRLVHIDPGYAGPTDTVIDGSGFCVMPGMVNVHTHLQSESLGRGLIEELGNQALYQTGILDEKSVFVTSGLTEQAGGAPAQLKANKASTENAVAELLKSGCTTVTDLAVAWDGWLDTLAATGIRAVVAPMYRDARWYVPTGHRLDYQWDLEKGRRDFATALAAADAALKHPSGRLGAMLAPMQVDTCSPELIRDSIAAARERGIKTTVHCSQHIPEFQEMVRRHGVTPVQWMQREGLLGPDMLLGHAIFLDHHSLVQWWTKKDLDILAETGTSVAHCPVVFSRYGQMMEDVGGYIRKGVNVAMGTDTEPQNMAEEVRMASTMGRAAAKSVRGVWLSELFHAATIGGAKALGRDDLGRLAVGAKADLVLLDLEAPGMRPVRDPLRSFFFSAADRAVRHVFVDGRQVVRDGEILTIDRGGLSRPLQESQEAFVKNAPYVDFRGRSADEISPTSFRIEGKN